MFFLATPHRGSDSAKLLNNILRASTLLTARNYVADLGKNSASTQIISDEFKNHADRIQLWSFYETVKMRLGATAPILIVEPDSAILGYKHERVIPMNADHRTICKFDSPSDPNYILVRNSLSKAVDDVLGDGELKTLPSPFFITLPEHDGFRVD